MGACPHAIDSLPEELLSIVFVEWLEADHYDICAEVGRCLALQRFQRAFCLAAVSNKWRRVAISTPRLWRFVNILLALVTARSQALWTDYLRSCLLRSGAIKLELEIEGGMQDADCQSLPDFWASLRLSCAHARMLKIDVWISEPPMPALFLCCLAQDMPYLEYFKLHFFQYKSDNPRLKINLFQTAPRLCYLSYSGCSLVWPTNSLFPNVTSVSITTARMTISALLDMFQCLPNVQDLEVHTLSLSAADTSIDLSVLRCATLRDWAFHTEGFDETIVRNMDFPNLRSAIFTLQSSGVTPAALTTFFGHTLRAVRFLALERSYNITGGLLGYLDSMPRLRSLWLEGNHLLSSSNFLRGLLRPDASGAWPCPRLQHITLSGWDIDSASECGIAFQVATARGPCASPRRRPPRLLLSLRVTSSPVSPFDWTSRIEDREGPDAESLQAALDLILRDWDTDESEDA